LFVQIDIGFGDTVYPEIEKMAYPTLINLPAPNVNAYSKESIIAEKFQAIVSLGYVNTRMKDFYDIFALMSSFDFDYLTLKEAILETFSNRKTSFGLIVVFDSEFYNDTKRIRLWNSFTKTKHLDAALKFSEIVSYIQTFLEPIYDQTIEYDYHKWNHLELSWN
jgi:predicted nucleotidyltransferase component of viral defense system